jgi:hypothetical protein
MRAHNYPIHHTLIIVLISLLPVCSLATVKEVTLFPNSTKISETAKINPQCNKGRCKTLITLPAQADAESLVVSLPPESRVKIEDVQAKAVQVQDEARIAELRKQIAGLENEKKRNSPNCRLSKHSFSSGRRKQKQKQKQLLIPIN